MSVDPPNTGTAATAARPKKVSTFFLLGPAFVAAIAYVDPGNVAANLSAGAQYGYLLVWVLVAANLIAGLVQYLSSKLGLVSGQSLPSLLGGRLRRRSRLAYWVQAEIVAIATDIAEVIGGAIALKILFDLPLLLGGIIVGVVSLVLLSIQSTRGQR
ncbi:MAG: Nramp family divalent metal transporter, partial [Brevibacterium sp.]|nr:Nramp family divalent metal transporter [Brevibacterium sp.]